MSTCCRVELDERLFVDPAFSFDFPEHDSYGHPYPRWSEEIMPSVTAWQCTCGTTISVATEPNGGATTVRCPEPKCSKQQTVLGVLPVEAKQIKRDEDAR